MLTILFNNCELGDADDNAEFIFFSAALAKENCKLLGGGLVTGVTDAVSLDGESLFEVNFVAILKT